MRTDSWESTSDQVKVSVDTERGSRTLKLFEIGDIIFHIRDPSSLLLVIFLRNVPQPGKYMST